MVKIEKVLITGGAGFIGSHTADFLIENGYEVRILDNLEPQVHQMKIPEYLHPKAEFMQGDVTDIIFLEKALKDIDVVIHLAALVGIAQSMYQPSRYLSVNTVGTANLYELLLRKPSIRKNIKKIIILGSKTIYGEGTYECKNCGIVHPLPRSRKQLEKKDWEVHCPNCNEYVKSVGTKEDKPPNILSVYALSKYDTERLAMNFSFALNIPTFIFRGFSAYGPRQSLNNPYSGVIAIFSNRIKNKKPLIIFEDGKQLRDYIYVEDMARLIQLSLEKDKCGVYNVGTGIPTSVLEIANNLIDIFDSNVECEITEEFRVGDNRHDFADISKIEKELKFKPEWKLRHGLEKFVEWSEKQKTMDVFEKAEVERKAHLG